MKGDRAIRRGTVVYDVANPRRHGIVRTLHLCNGKFTANVQWIDTGWHETRVPVADLRRVTAETPSTYLETFGRVPSLPRAAFDPWRAPRIEFASYDGFPTRLASTGEIWCLFSRYDQRSTGKWSVPTRAMQVFCYEAGVLTEQEYHRRFGHDLPPLPDAAFCSRWFSPLL